MTMPKTKAQIGKRIKQLVTERRFQFIRVCIPPDEFALRPHQRDELSKWASAAKFDTEWLQTDKDGMRFIDADGKANALALDDRAWQSEEEMVSAKWQELCAARSFDCVKVQVGDATFGLRGDQEKELIKFGDKKKYDKAWLHLKNGSPSHFEAQDGSENALLFTEDAWVEAAQKGKRKGESSDAEGASSSKQVKGSKGGLAEDIGIELGLGERQGVLVDWANDWYCYWDGSYGMPADPRNFVFKPSLEMTSSGVVRTKEWDLFSCNSTAAVKGTLEGLFDVVKQLEGGERGNEIGLGDESDHPWHPFAISWTKADGELSPQSLLGKLGAHEQLQNESAITMLGDDEDDEDEDSGPGISVFLDKHTDKGPLYFYTGSGLMNPVVVFAVAKVEPGLVAGFVGGIVHT